MSLNSAQIFIETDDFEQLTSELSLYLSEWFEERFRQLTRRDDPSRHFLDKDRRRGVIALPPTGGWSVLVEKRSERADAELARHLSQRLGTRVVWFELQGRRLRFRHQIIDSGRPFDLEAEPPRVWSPLKSELFPMVAYPDIEPIAYRILKDLGLPDETLFLVSDDITIAPGGPGSAMYSLMLHAEDGPRIESLRFEPSWSWGIAHEEPVREDFHGMHQDGLRTVTLETRLLRGVPDEAAAMNLVSIERHARQRLERYLYRNGVDLGRHVIDFRYRSEDHDTTLLEALVKQARLELDR
ncbi:MAG: hypothetical protein RL885_00265 [Planctomycetota bacterium]